MMDQHALVRDFGARYLAQDLGQVYTGQGIDCWRKLTYETSDVDGRTVVSADEDNLFGLCERCCGFGGNLSKRERGRARNPIKILLVADSIEFSVP
jgi:hypothetical protein